MYQAYACPFSLCYRAGLYGGCALNTRALRLRAYVPGRIPGLHREFVDTKDNTLANREELVDSKTKSVDDFFSSKLVNIFS